MAKYDKPLDKDEENKDAARYRLPFALCKQRGISLPDWATPRDAWNALKGYGINPEKEYERMQQARERAKAKRKEKKERKRQANDPEHSPDYKYIAKPGEVAGVKQGKPMSFEEADGGKPNPYYNNNKLFGYKTNCQTCVVAFEARMRGYDVRALPNNRNGYIRDLSYDTNLAYTDKDGNLPSYIHPSPREKKSAFLERCVQDGKRYTVEWTWKNGHSGHIISVTRENGKLKFYDPQNGKIMDFNQFQSNCLSRSKGNLKLLRVDNLEFNPEYANHILKGVKK